MGLRSIDYIVSTILLYYPWIFSRVRVHNVQLVPRGQPTSPSRRDRAVDLAHVFERRRAVMDSAIVRILKKEKQMSVDNIAHKVRRCLKIKPPSWLNPLLLSTYL